MLSAQSSLRRALWLMALSVVVLGCGSLPVVVTPSSALPPVTPTAPPLYQQVTLTTQDSTETGQPYNFTITLSVPFLAGSDDPRVRVFNDELGSIGRDAAEKFKQDLINVPPTPISAGSYFDVRYELLSPPGNIFSIKYSMEGYVTGAAHPYHLNQTVNFDLQQGRDLSLAELFIPGTDYLQSISDYCVSQLKTRDIAFDMFTAGADPTPENYRNWNITADGLLITFDEYQVAPYAAGPQLVTIPYAELRSILSESGPAAQYFH